jgi:hypothetical protein
VLKSGDEIVGSSNHLEASQRKSRTKKMEDRRGGRARAPSASSSTSVGGQATVDKKSRTSSSQQIAPSCRGFRSGKPNKPKESTHGGVGAIAMVDDAG